MLRGTLLASGLLACIAACSGKNGSVNELASAPPGDGTRARAAGERRVEAQPGVQASAESHVDAQAIAGRRYWADPQRAGWSYEIDLCSSGRAIERETGTRSEGTYELRGSELLIQFADRAARFQFPSGPDFMIGTSKLGRPQKLEHKGESDCTKLTP